MTDWEVRVLLETGVYLQQIAWGVPEDLLGGCILLRREDGGEVIARVGYPTITHPVYGEVWGPECLRRIVLTDETQ